MGESGKELAAIRAQLMEAEAEVLRISERERSRFSMDLHDDICQRLAGISLFCQGLIRRENPQPFLPELAEMIEETLTRTRRYAHDTFPAELDTGLKEALASLCHRVNGYGGCSCDLLWSDPESPLTPAQNLHICRIVQEAVQNAVKHAGATRIQVEVRVGEGEVLVVVEDNGSGIKGSGDNGADNGLGLCSMRYRARQLGAVFSIKPVAEGGTRIEIRIPMKLP